MSPFAVKLSVILFIGRIALKLKCTTLLPARQNSSRPWRKRKIPCQDVICCPSWCFWVRQNWRCGAFQLRILSRHLLKKEAKLKTHWMLGNLYRWQKYIFWQSIVSFIKVSMLLTYIHNKIPHWFEKTFILAAYSQKCAPTLGSALMFLC